MSRQGELGLGEAMTAELAATLMRVHGLAHDDALGLALDVAHDDWANLIANEDTAPSWLFARPDETSQARWVTAIVDTDGGVEILKLALPGTVAVDLHSIARRVFTAGVLSHAGAGHA